MLFLYLQGLLGYCAKTTSMHESVGDDAYANEVYLQ
jgi:hypothetical protein